MSIATTTTLAATRDERAPKKKDIGKAKSEDSADKPGLFDLLVTLVPTEAVVPYTLVTTGIVAFIDKPTVKVPNPEQYELWRWLTFLFLLIALVGLVLNGKRGKSDKKRFPLPELIGSLVAGIGFGLAIPDSPLYAHYSNKEAAIASLVIAFGAICINLALGRQLQKPVT